MKIGLLGSVQSTQVALETLTATGYKPAVVITLPRDKSHRHSDFVDMHGRGVDVVEVANTHGAEWAQLLASLKLDLLLVVGWSRLVSGYTIPRLGSIGFHTSLLPDNRGRATIPWTIIQGASHTGSTLFWLADGADSGDIVDQERFTINPYKETATTLYAKHMDALGRMLKRSIAKVVNETADRIEQDESHASYCSQRVEEDGLIDWSLPGWLVHRLVRASTRPYPGAYTRAGIEKIVIWDAGVESERRYWGVPGQVQYLVDGKPAVQCGDRTRLVVSEFEIVRATGPREFKVGERWGK